MKIGICHFRVGELDGVSLEIAKWERVLGELGHRVHLCAGSLGEEGFLIPQLDPKHPSIQRILQNSFIRLADYDEPELRREIERMAATIEQGLRTFIAESSIDLLVVENIWSLPPNLPAAIALWRVIRDLKLPTIAHHHDFYWEKPFYRPNCPFIGEVLGKLFPPRGLKVEHVVLNSLAQARLRREGLPAEVIPNVIDFAAPPWMADEFNRDFKEAIGVRREDLPVLQATRIVRRKGIELAVDLVKELEEELQRMRGLRLYDGREVTGETRPVLVLSNRPEEGYLEGGYDYYEQLREKIAREGVEVRSVGDLIGSNRSEKGKKIYSFWDAYVFADLITYPSLQEGWGNQLLEAIFARKPVVLFEYEVFRADIKPRGFRFISLGSEYGHDEAGLARLPPQTLRQAARRVLHWLSDETTYREVTEHNFLLGRRYYSFEALRDQLHGLFSRLPQGVRDPLRGG